MLVKVVALKPLTATVLDLELACREPLVFANRADGPPGLPSREPTRSDNAVPKLVVPPSIECVPLKYDACCITSYGKWVQKDVESNDIDKFLPKAKKAFLETVS